MTGVYAIRVGDHVEVRISASKPRKLVSKWTKLVEGKVDMKYTRTPPYYKATPMKIELKQVFFVGGRVVGYVKVGTFKSKTGLTVVKDKLVEVPKPHSDIILDIQKRRLIID